MIEKIRRGFARWSSRWTATAAGNPFADTVVIGPSADDRFGQLFEEVGEALVICDDSGTVLAANRMALILCTRPGEALIGSNFQLRLRSGGPAESDPLPAQREVLFHHASGEWVAIGLRETPLRTGGNVQRLFHLVDLETQSRLAARLHEIANFDSLTRLPNRALFRDRLTEAMKRATRSGVPLALMFLDLDRFKLVNDSLGHGVGDRLLVHIAETLTSCLRAIDSVARPSADGQVTLSRLGGDEFTVIAEAIGNPENASYVAQRLLDALSTPFIAGDQRIVMEASIGIALYATGDLDIDALIRHADLAMYRSKSLGRGIFSFFSDDMNKAVSHRLALESDLRRAVERAEFELHYQPKVDAQSGAVTGVEALLRWHCPGRGTVRPDHFIAVLEDTGLIVPVGAWVIAKACAEMALWDRLGLPPFRMAVNMSARQFHHQHLAALIEDSLRQNDIAPARLEIELTETLLMEDNEASRNMFASFARIGVGLAIDDFGTGHSSLAYLKRFNIDTLKIDRSFVSGLPDDPDDKAIASAVIAMGHSMHMRVVAEGVESQDQAECLRLLGCDELQGYLVSRPLPAAAFVAWLHDYEEARNKARGPTTYGRATFISRLLNLDELA